MAKKKKKKKAEVGKGSTPSAAATLHQEEEGETVKGDPAATTSPILAAGSATSKI
jgi:hypothetical protein